MGSKVIGKITGTIAFAGPPGVLEFAAMDEITRIRKRGHRQSIDDARIPAAVIEVEMRVHDDINLLGLKAARSQLREQPRRALKGVDLAFFRVPFISGSGFHQNPLRRCANEQRIHGQRDAILVVGRRDALPHGTRNDAKHRSSIEAKGSVSEDVKFDGAEFHLSARDVPARANNSRTAA